MRPGVVQQTRCEMRCSLAVVIPATNDPPTLERCLAAVEASSEPPDEVHVVRDAGAPGPAAARNAGVRRTAADVVAFVDADVVVHADALRRLREAFADDAGLAAVFGAYDDEPAADGAVSGFRNLLHHHVHHRSPGPATTFWAGLGAVRRDAFLAVGGFDEDRYRRPSIEDVELGSRLAAAGFRIELRPDVQGTHLKRWSLLEMLRTDFLLRGLPWSELLLAGAADRTALNLGWRHRASALASLGAAAAVARRKPVAAVASSAVLVALNRDFYGLLARRRGPWQAGAGVALHALHHLTGVAALAAGAVRRTVRARQ